MANWKDSQYGSGCSAIVKWFSMSVSLNMSKNLGEKKFIVSVNGKISKNTFDDREEAKKYAEKWLKKMCEETLNEINKE